MATNQTAPTAIRVIPAWSALASAGAFVILGVAAQAAQPSIDPEWQPPSELALGPSGWLMTTAFAMLGVAGVALFLALCGQAATWPGKVGRALILVGAAGGFVAALFPTDPSSTPPQEMSLTGTLHAIGPVLGDAFTLASLLLAVSLTRRSTGWRPYRAALVAACVGLVAAVVVLTASMAMLMPANGSLGPEVLVGWQARVLLLAEAAWIGTVAACALAVHPREGPTDARPARTPAVAVAS